MAPNPPRRGRPPTFVKDDEGADIKGLSAQPVRRDGKVVGYRYYATYAKPRAWFGNDRDMAIMRFRAWEAEQTEQTVTVTEAGRPSPQVVEDWQHWAESHPEPGARQYYRDALKTDHTVKPKRIQDKAFWKAVRQAIIDDPKRVAQKTGIRELAYLTDLKPPAPSLKLSEIGELYLSREFGDRDECQRFKTAWDEFCTAVKAERVNEITQDDIHNYDVAIRARKLEPKTIKHRYDRISTILDYVYARRKDHRSELAELKTDFRAICRQKVSKRGKPHPIHPDDFHALYDAANSAKLRAITLCMMNFAMHASEATDLLKDDIDLRQNHLWTNRHKTGEVERVGRMWPETKAAIKAYQAEQSKNPAYRDAEHLFLTNDDAPYVRGGLIQYFRETWKPRAEKLAGRKLKFTLDSIRDGAQNAADEADCDPIHTSMLMGQILPGVSDAYKSRRPSKTEKSVTAIYDRYRISSMVNKILRGKK